MKANGVDIDEAINKFDSYNALEKGDARIMTGPTDTNVTDLHLLAVEGKTSSGRKSES